MTSSTGLPRPLDRLCLHDQADQGALDLFWDLEEKASTGCVTRPAWTPRIVTIHPRRDYL